MRDTHAIVVALLLVVVAPAGAVVPAAGAPTADPSATATGVPSATVAQQDCSYPVTRPDATGTEVTVEERPGRIVTAGPSAAQVMWELGAQNRVVGMPVDRTTAYLDGSGSKTDVLTDEGRVDREQVVALEPDLVVLANIYPNTTARSLRDAGLTVYRADFPGSLDGIRQKVRVYGEFVGECDAARNVNAEFNASIEEIRANASDRYRPRAFFYFFNFTAGQGTFTDELIATAGGRNVAAEAGIQGFRQFSPEIVADRDPEVVVVPGDSPLPSGAPWNSTTAFERGQVYRVDTNLIQQPAPRVVQPLRTMQAAFGEYASIRETATPSPTASPTPTEESGPTTVAATEEPTTAPPTATPAEDDQATTPGGDSGGDGAGLGVVPAVAAVLGLALLALRRR